MEIDFELSLGENLIFLGRDSKMLLVATSILELLLPSERVLEKTAFLKELIIIFIAIKVIGHLSKKIGQPSVFGKLLVGIILGPSIFGILHPNHMLHELAEVGVILLMFLAGLETDVEEFKKSAFPSTLVAVGGVVLPMLSGAFVAHSYGYDWKISIFIGTVLVATSVSISVQTLRELGKLQTKEGLTILGAAVIDDVLGLITLSVVLSLTLGGGVGVLAITILFAKLFAFFGMTIIIGVFAMPKILNFAARLTTSQGVLTFALIIALAFAVLAEYFGLAGIVGAYLAGIMVSLTEYQHHIYEKVETVGFSFFVPIFFVNIGVAADVSGLFIGSNTLIIFTIIITVLAVLSKIIGSGLGAKLSGFSWKNSVGIGSGMVSRGEVALIVSSIGLNSGIITAHIFTSLIVMTIVTTVATPPLLKVVFKSKT